MGPGVLTFGDAAQHLHRPDDHHRRHLPGLDLQLRSVAAGVVAHYTFNRPTGSISDGQVMPDAAGTGYVMYNRGAAGPTL